MPSAFVLPHLWMLRQEGLPLVQVERELGAPLRRRGKEDFRCLPNHSCRRKAPPEGPVLFNGAGVFGYFLYVNEAGGVVDVETNSS